MTLRFNCPECGKKLKAPDEHAGRTAICHGCGAKVPIPPLPPPESAEAGPEGQTSADQPLVVLPPRPAYEDLIDMTAMVDIVFFLLIFFLVTSIQAIQAVINMPPPQAAVGTAGRTRSIADYEQDPDYMIVRVEEDDSLWVEETQVYSDQDLRVRLRSAASDRDRPPSVLVIGSADASHGAAVRVFDACAYARVKEVSFVVKDSDAAASP